MRNRDDLLKTSPFLIERQLEDQRCIIANNKKVHSLTLDNVSNRKELFVKKDLKSLLLTKIVRNALGDNTYYYPNETNKTKSNKKNVNPYMYPSIKIYEKECRSKEIAVSFGHRKHSASRLFHPATMKVHLKHSECVDSPLPYIGIPADDLSILLRQSSSAGISQRPISPSHTSTTLPPQNGANEIDAFTGPTDSGHAGNPTSNVNNKLNTPQPLHTSSPTDRPLIIMTEPRPDWSVRAGYIESATPLSPTQKRKYTRSYSALRQRNEPYASLASSPPLVHSRSRDM